MTDTLDSQVDTLRAGHAAASSVAADLAAALATAPVTIRTEAEHRAAMEEIDGIFDAVPGTPECERLDALVDAVVAYEEAQWPMDQPATIRDAQHRAKARKRELLPQLAAQLDTALVALQAAAATVAALADADTVNGLAHHLVEVEDDDA